MRCSLLHISCARSPADRRRCQCRARRRWPSRCRPWNTWTPPSPLLCHCSCQLQQLDLDFISRCICSSSCCTTYQLKVRALPWSHREDSWDLDPMREIEWVDTWHRAWREAGHSPDHALADCHLAGLHEISTYNLPAISSACIICKFAITIN